MAWTRLFEAWLGCFGLSCFMDGNLYVWTIVMASYLGLFLLPWQWHKTDDTVQHTGMSTLYLGRRVRPCQPGTLSRWRTRLGWEELMIHLLDGETSGEDWQNHFLINSGPEGSRNVPAEAEGRRLRNHRKPVLFRNTVRVDAEMKSRIKSESSLGPGAMVSWWRRLSDDREFNSLNQPWFSHKVLQLLGDD